MRIYDINKRSVYVFCRLRTSYAGMKTFLTLMSFPLPMTKKNSKLHRTIHKVVKTVAESCLSDATKKVKAINGANNTSLVPQSLMIVPGRGVTLLQ